MKYKFKRIFVIVADSVGIGAEPDAAKYDDEGTNTLVHISEAMPNGLNIPTMNSLGLGDLAPIIGTSKVSHKNSYVMCAQEKAMAKIL